MADKITYYAIIDEASSRDDPAGVLRRDFTEIAPEEADEIVDRIRVQASDGD